MLELCIILYFITGMWDCYVFLSQVNVLENYDMFLQITRHFGNRGPVDNFIDMLVVETVAVKVGYRVYSTLRDVWECIHT